MIALLIIIGSLLAGYGWLVHVQMAKAPALRYNAVFARVLRSVTAGRMRCLTLWRTCWLLYPPGDVRGVVNGKAWLHELYHIERQWGRWPYTMPLRYLWQLVRYGYDRHPMEQAARRAAGEPER